MKNPCYRLPVRMFHLLDSHLTGVNLRDKHHGVDGITLQTYLLCEYLCGLRCHFLLLLVCKSKLFCHFSLILMQKYEK